MKRKNRRTAGTSQVNIESIKNDDELRIAVWNNPDNGSYADIICRGCGSFTTSEESSAKTCEIVDKCSSCDESTTELKF